MKKLFLFSFFLTTIVTVFNCRKESSPKPGAPETAVLLTKKTWTLLTCGYDYNNDGAIDSFEEGIKDCEKDNTYTFNTDGSGVVMENSKICNGNSPRNEFTWNLTNNETELDFTTGIVLIAKLTQNTLVMSDKNTGPGKSILIYSH